MFDCFGVVSSIVLPVWFKKKFCEQKGAELSDYYCQRGDRGELSLKQIALSVANDHKLNQKKILTEWVKTAKLNNELVDFIIELKANNEVVLASNAANGLVESVFKKHKIEKLPH